MDPNSNYMLKTGFFPKAPLLEGYPRAREEARQLIENGFEYVCTTPDEIMLFRKRK